MLFTPPATTLTELNEKINSANLSSNKINKALKIAQKAHCNQYRDDGEPYLTQHIYPIVSAIIEKFADSPKAEDLIITSLLHDVLEDAPQISKATIKRTFGGTVFGYLKLLTKPYTETDGLSDTAKEKIQKEMFFKISSADDVVKIVKVEDRINNLQSTLSISGNTTYKRQLKMAKDFYLTIVDNLNPNYRPILSAEITRLEKTQ